MPDPIFLSLSRVLALHREIIDIYGGSDGLRDRGLAESAVAQPSARYDGAYLHTDLFEMAAAYLFHLVSNHPFVDGNKRIGAAAAIIFLELNGIEIDADEHGLVEITLAAASGRTTKPEIAEFFRSRAIRK